MQNLIVSVGDAMGSGYYIAPITQSANIPVKYYWWAGLSDYGIADGWYTTDDGSVLEEAISAGTLDSYKADLSLAKGEGLITYMQDAGLTLQGSGEVLIKDFSRSLNKDYTGIANPYVLSLSLTSIKVNIADAMGSGYYIAPISSSGNIPVKYYWWAGLSDYGIVDGWYTTDDGSVLETAISEGTLDSYKADYVFKSGEAAITYMQDAGVTLSITSPINL